MTLALRLALLAAFVFFSPQRALAVSTWTTVSTAVVSPTTTTTTYTMDFTDTTDATAGVDTRTCDMATLSFNASVADADTTA